VQVGPLAPAERDRLSEQLAGASTIEAILRRAAQSLGVLTQELGVAVGPHFELATLRQVDLVRLASDRVLVVLTLDHGVVRTVFVEVPGAIADEAVREVARVLNERLAGLALRDLRVCVAERLRDAASGREGSDDLLNIFVSGGGQLFERAAGEDAQLLLGQPSLLADQPEFASGPDMRRLLELTETREELAVLLRRRAALSAPAAPEITVTIGAEHADPRLEPFTLVTAEYRAGNLAGVIGVIGPTRMPYDKVIAIVSHTSRLVSELLH
jgi:heat-inducible transcriptional repressor